MTKQMAPPDEYADDAAKDAFFDTIQRECRARAVAEQKHRSWGSVKQCCKTCNGGIEVERYGYVDCITHGEVRVPSSYCLDWAKKDKVKK